MNYAEWIFAADLCGIDPSFDGIDKTQDSSTDVSPIASLLRSSTIQHALPCHLCQMFTSSDYPNSGYTDLLRVTRGASVCCVVASSWRAIVRSRGAATPKGKRKDMIDGPRSCVKILIRLENSWPSCVFTAAVVMFRTSEKRRSSKAIHAATSECHWSSLISGLRG